MTNRRIMWIALAFAILVQAGFVAGYARMTGGCFCVTTGYPDPPRPPPHVVWFVMEFSSFPLGRFSGPSSRIDVIGWVAVNAVPWFIGAYLLLKAVVLLFRVQIRPHADGVGVRGNRFHLVDAAQVRPKWIALLALVAVAAMLTAGAAHRRWWHSESDRAVHAAIAAARTGTQPPAELALAFSAGAIGDDPQRFPGPYILERDPKSDGTHPLDWFVPPDGRHGWIRFRGGARFSYYVFREPTGWEVSIHSRIP